MDKDYGTLLLAGGLTFSLVYRGTIFDCKDNCPTVTDSMQSAVCIQPLVAKARGRQAGFPN